MPIVVEQDFREHFSIASATPAYRRMLAAAPGEFVGSVSRLAAIVVLLSDGVKRAFADQGLPLPPWRRSKSVMSKWGMGPNAHGELHLSAAGLGPLDGEEGWNSLQVTCERRSCHLAAKCRW